VSVAASLPLDSSPRRGEDAPKGQMGGGGGGGGPSSPKISAVTPSSGPSGHLLPGGEKETSRTHPINGATGMRS